LRQRLSEGEGRRLRRHCRSLKILWRCPIPERRRSPSTDVINLVDALKANRAGRLAKKPAKVRCEAKGWLTLKVTQCKRCRSSTGPGPPPTSRPLELTRRNQNRRACLVAILRCRVVLVDKGFRPSTIWASEPREIRHSMLALKTNESERRGTFRADRMITRRQRIQQKVFNSAHNRTFGGERDASLR
jgi:hypothetical protein